MERRFELLPGAPAFMAHLADDARSCTSRLWIQFSTFEGDRSGEAVAELMLDRAAAGADVRFLVDHYSDAIANDILPTSLARRAELAAERRRTEALLERLRAGGVTIHRTAPLGRYWRSLPFRDHKKLVILDDRVAYVGGVNVSEHNFAWHDFMVRTTAPLVDDLVADFAATWDGDPAFEPDRTDDLVDFVLTHAPGRDDIMREAVALVDRAQRSVLVESPSLLDRDLERALALAARRGVQVAVVVPARHNRTVFRMWSAAAMRSLARAGVRVYRYRGSRGMTHAKALIADEWATFGSFNFFGLESLCQKELNVFTRDADLVSELRSFVERDIEDSSLETAHSALGSDWGYGLVMRVLRRHVRSRLRDPHWVRTYA